MEAQAQQPPTREIPISVSRDLADKVNDGVKLPAVIEEERTVDFEGRTLRLTLLRPLGTEHEVLPVLIYYHGGGYVLGSIAMHGLFVKEMVVKNRMAVVFPDYSMAPEFKFPVAHEECFATLQWLRAHAKEIQIDASKVAVAGDSAGGTLAFSVALMAKQRGLPADVIKAQIGLYPGAALERDGYRSYHEFGNGDYPVDRDHIRYFINDLYLGEDWQERGDKKWVAPLLASVEELSGLPPALIITAECDALRDEGEEYSRKLLQAGVDTMAVRTVSTFHGYMTVPIVTPAYHHTHAVIKHHLDGAFGRQ